jgi:hypothetical protein
MSLVSGDNFVFYIYNGGTWKPYVCARSGSMAINTETIETTVTGSGNYKTYEPTVHSFTANIDGVISLNVVDSLSIADLQALQLAKTKILCRFIQTSQAGDTYIKEAYFFITNSTDTGSFDGVATFNLSLIGTGSITTIFTPPTPTTAEVIRYPAAGDTAPATPGAYTWATGLTGKTILSIVKDGRGQSDIILSGTPVGNEALYDTATGDITFAIPFEDVETAPYMLYQNT